MRDKIRLPADVEFSIKFLNAKNHVAEGQAEFLIESVPSGKFEKITKLTITLPGLGEVIVITPKERRPFNERVTTDNRTPVRP